MTGYKFGHLSFNEIETRMRQIGNIWLKNDDLLLLEELIRRAKKSQDKYQPTETT